MWCLVRNCNGGLVLKFKLIKKRTDKTVWSYPSCSVHYWLPCTWLLADTFNSELAQSVNSAWRLYEIVSQSEGWRWRRYWQYLDDNDWAVTGWKCGFQYPTYLFADGCDQLLVWVLKEDVKWKYEEKSVDAGDQWRIVLSLFGQVCKQVWDGCINGKWDDNSESAEIC